MPGDTLIVRADANNRMGAGHLMRTLALGQAWQDAGGRVVFTTACDNPALIVRLGREGFAVQELEPDAAWSQIRAALAPHGGCWVVLDGYHFDTRLQRRIREAGHPLLVVDDTAHLPEPYEADLLLNQNINAPSMRYRTRRECQLLLGPEYILLRREFLHHRGFSRQVTGPARRLLVTLGGAELQQQLQLVLEGLERAELAPLEVDVLVGGGAGLDELRQVASRSGHAITFSPGTDDMAGLMARADLAITGGGSTCWELAFMKLPSLVLVLADNQQQAMASLHRRGTIVNLGWHHQLRPETLAPQLSRLVQDHQQRAEMAARGAELVDGEGGRRVVAAMRESAQRAAGASGA